MPQFLREKKTGFDFLSISQPQESQTKPVYGEDQRLTAELIPKPILQNKHYSNRKSLVNEQSHSKHQSDCKFRPISKLSKQTPKSLKSKTPIVKKPAEIQQNTHIQRS